MPDLLSYPYAYLLLSLLPLYYFLFPSIRRLLIPRGIKGIPALSGSVPIWGDIPVMGKMIGDHDSFSYFFDWVGKELGPIAQVRAGWFLNIVIISHIPTIESILLRPMGTFDRSPDIIKSFGQIIPRALLTLPTNDVYKHHRRIIGTAMTSKYLARATPRAYEGVKELVGLWGIKAKKSGGRSWAVEEDMQGATMDAISAMAFGESLGIMADRIRQLEERDEWPIGSLGEMRFQTKNPIVAESIMHVFDSLPLQSFFPAVSHFFTRLTPRYRRHAGILDEYLKTKLAASRAKARALGADNAADLAENTLDLMVGRELKGDDFLSVDEMRDELYLYLLGGTETSSTTLSWWIKYMTTHPDIQRKLRNSILESIPELQDRPPTYEDLTPANLPYLEAVVQETLRVSRTAGGVSRTVMQDTTILGHFVPKGTLVVLPANSHFEDEDHPMHTLGPMSGEAPGPQASSSTQKTGIEEKDESSTSTSMKGKWAAGTGKRFDPERWLKDGVFDPNAGPSFPFSLGQRGCFGKGLALMELRMFCLVLNQSFFFAPVEPCQSGFQRKETVTSHPVYAYVRPVEWDSEDI